MSSLSGGNQQKVLLARWLATKAKVLMFDEPTKGVDVGAKAEIYKVIGDLAAEGLGVVVVSSYLPEVLGLADRVLVMREGAVAGELPAAGRDGGGRAASGQHAEQCEQRHERRRRRGVLTERERDIMRFVKSTIHQPTPAAAGAGAGAPRPRRRRPSPRSASSRSATSSGATPAASSSCSSCSAAMTLASNEFLTADNMANLARQVAVFGIIAVGQLLVILTAGIDLSVGSVLGLTGCIAAELLVHGTGIVPAILIGDGRRRRDRRLQRLARRLRQAAAVHRHARHARASREGSVLVLTDASTVQPLPDAFGNIANGDFLGLPNLLWMFVVVVVIASFVLRRTVFGRYVYAVGSNPESARLAGVPVTRVLVAVYAISGLLAAVGGVLFTSRLNAGVPTAGTGYELNAIAACVIGGASLFGAKGGAFGAAAGALIVGVLNNGGNLLAINSFYLQIIIGALILAAVAFDQWQGRRARGS